MEKLVFVFRRKAGLSRQDFHRHYVDDHSPLGLRLQRGLSGYTVNHLVTDAEFDTVTEIWTPSARSFTGGGGEPNMEIVADHMSFMGPQDAYVVEETILRDGPQDPPLGRPGSRRKVVTFHTESSALPPADERAVRVVDNVVVEQLYARDQRLEPGSDPAFAVIRTSWFDDADIAGDPAEGVAVREYRYRAAEEAEAQG